MAKVTGGELPATIWNRFMSVAEKGLPSRDFPWLVAEPAASPLQTVSEETTPYEDEPPIGGGPRDAMDGGDSAIDQPPNEDDRAVIDSGDGRGPVIIHGGRYSDGRPLPRGYYDGDSDADAPPEPPRRGEGRRRRRRLARAAPPQSPADDDPRYRY